MERKMSKKAMEIAKEIEKDYNGDVKVSIYFGTPNAKYTKQWLAFTKISSGLSVDGLYGLPLRSSKTLSGLIIEGKYEHPGCGVC